MINVSAPDTVSLHFNACDSDIVVRSVDGVLFQVHRKNPEVHSDVFAAAEAISPLTASEEVEILQLSEISWVLDLPLQFMYGQPQPDLCNVPFDILADLSTAVDKYNIFSAITKCEIAMSAALDTISGPRTGLTVLTYCMERNTVINTSSTELRSIPSRSSLNKL